MSREIYYYKNIESQTAFLAGVADISLNYIIEAIDNHATALESDVFFVGAKGIDGLYDVIIEKLNIYNAIDRRDTILEKDTFMPNLPLEKVKGNKIIDCLVQTLYPRYTKSKNLKAGLESFYYSLSWYLNPARALWKMDMQLLQKYMHDLSDSLALNYTYIVTDVYFLEFKEYVLMLVVGSDE